MRDEGGPDWVRDALHQGVDEVRSFLRTAFGFTLRPGRFAREWAAGERRALNPLGFLATAFAVVGTAALVMQHLVHETDDDPSLLWAALGALLPFIYYLLLGVFQHGVLRLFGSRRPLRDTCAMALYAGGGPATAMNLALMTLQTARYEILGDMRSPRGWWLVIAGASLVFLIFWTALSAAVGALHSAYGIRWGHLIAANCVAMVATGMLFALFDPRGNFGLHLVLGPSHKGGEWHLAVGLRY